jgi:hypothetical protein
MKLPSCSISAIKNLAAFDSEKNIIILNLSKIKNTGNIDFYLITIIDFVIFVR